MSDEFEKVSTCVFWDLDDFPFPHNLNPFILYRNLKSGLEDKGYPGGLTIWFYYGKNKTPPEVFVDVYYDAGYNFFLNESDDIYGKATRMIRDALLWSVDHRVRNNPEPFNLVLVSNKFSSGEIEEPLSILQDLKSRNFKILLALSQEPESGALFPTVSFDWLWQTILADTCSLCSECALEAAANPKKRPCLGARQ